MSFIEDIPFDGDASQPLPEELQKVRRTAIEYSMKLLKDDAESFALTNEQQLFMRFFLEGVPKKDPIDEALERELNAVKLEVEIEAIRKRAQDKKDQRDKVLAVYRSVDLMAQHNIDQALAKPLFSMVDNKDMATFKALFSELGSDRLSTNRLAELIEPCKWLCKEYIKIANTGSVRSAMGTSGNVEAKDIATAVNLLNVKVTTLLLPELILKNNIRSHKGLGLEAWQRLLKFQQLYAIASYQLAKCYNLNPDNAYLAAAFSIFPEMTFFNIFCSEGRKAKLASIDKARGLQDAYRSSVLDDYQPGAEGAIKLMAFAPSLLGIALDAFNFVHIPVLQILEEQDGFSDEYKVVQRAKGYVTYRLLTSANLLPQNEANAYLKTFDMDQNSLSQLQNIQLSQLSVFSLD